MSYADHIWHPSESEAVSSYYAVYKEAVGADGIFSNASFGSPNFSVEDKMSAIRSDFLSILTRIIDYERGKEKSFIKAFIEKYSKVDKELGDLLKSCLETNNFTEAFNYIHIKQHNLKKGIAQLPYDLEKWNKYMKSYMNIYIKKTSEEAVRSIKDIGTKSPEEIAQNIFLYLKNNYQGDAQHKDNFMSFMQTFEQELLPILQTNKKFGGKNWNIPTNEIKLGNKKASTNKNIIDSYVPAIIDGLVNGLSQEEFIVDFYGGASTARATRELSFFSGRKSQNVQTETDAYLVLGVDLLPSVEANEFIKQLQTDTDIANFVNTIPEDSFVIHYSSKDASIVLDSSDAASAKIGKIKGMGSLDSKIDVLKSLSSEGGFSQESINDMIFTIVNNGVGLIYEGKGLDQIIEAITSMTIGFMFEDFDEQIKNINTNTSNNELHLFFLTGRFVPISEVLEKFRMQIEGALNKKVVTINIKPSGTLYTSQDPYGETRWNFVRNKTIKSTSMGIFILNNLFNELGI